VSTRRNAIYARLGPRVGLVAGGLITILYGLRMIDKGVSVYLNNTYRATTYSAGTVAAGGFLILLALVPDRLVAFFLTKDSRRPRARSTKAPKPNCPLKGD
jgi:hypothetical protein